jgi:hypothetical protein
MPKKECCANCRFWKVVDDDPEEPGQCHRRAPLPLRLVGDANPLFHLSSTSWPVTTPDDWCGEFEPKKSSSRRR